MPTAFTDLTLCTTSDVYKRIASSGLTWLMGSSNDTERDTEVQSQIDLTKDYIRQRLIRYYRETRPTTVEQWIRYDSQKIEEARSRFANMLRSRGYSELPPSDYSDLLNDGIFVEPLSLHPGVFLNAGAPTTGTLANSADNGDILIDVTNWKSYQNRGTKASPTWTAWEPTGFIDYLLNPTELTRAAVTGTMLALYERGTLEDNGGLRENLTQFEAMKKRLAAQFEDELTLALDILQCDISGDSTISGFEQPMSDYGFS